MTIETYCRRSDEEASDVFKVKFQRRNYGDGKLRRKVIVNLHVVRYRKRGGAGACKVSLQNLRGFPGIYEFANARRSPGTAGTAGEAYDQSLKR